jgi:invasion protein IalB
VEVGALRRDIPVSVCLPRGCQAILPLDEGLVAALGAGSVYRVRFYTAESTPNEIEFSLQGFDEAYQALSERR